MNPKRRADDSLVEAKQDFFSPVAVEDVSSPASDSIGEILDDLIHCYEDCTTVAVIQYLLQVFKPDAGFFETVAHHGGGKQILLWVMRA